MSTIIDIFLLLTFKKLQNELQLIKLKRKRYQEKALDNLNKTFC